MSWWIREAQFATIMALWFIVIELAVIGEPRWDVIGYGMLGYVAARSAIVWFQRVTSLK